MIRTGCLPQPPDREALSIRTRVFVSTDGAVTQSHVVHGAVLAENSCGTHAVAAYAKRSMLFLLLRTSFQGDTCVTCSKSRITRTFWKQVNFRWTVHRFPSTHSGSLAGIPNRTSWTTMSVTTARPALSMRNLQTVHGY